jgi:DNA-directed RNA polymerase specialized sigma24 family protein
MHRQDQSEDIGRIFDAQHQRFLLAATSLLSCENCAEGLLQQASLQVTQATCISGGFEYSFAMRAVVRLAIAHMQHCPRPEKGRSHGGRNGLADARLLLQLLPWPERAAYFLREILGYSRRDSSLLIGMSDAQVDQMLAIARRRIASFWGAGPDALKILYRRELLEPSTALT